MAGDLILRPETRGPGPSMFEPPLTIRIGASNVFLDIFHHQPLFLTILKVNRRRKKK
jgi:hypothetical protein